MSGVLSVAQSVSAAQAAFTTAAVISVAAIVGVLFVRQARPASEPLAVEPLVPCPVPTTGGAQDAGLDLYEVADNGYNLHRGGTIDVPPGMEEVARTGAKVCPERAITIVE